MNVEVSENFVFENHMLWKPAFKNVARFLKHATLNGHQDWLIICNFLPWHFLTSKYLIIRDLSVLFLRLKILNKIVLQIEIFDRGVDRFNSIWLDHILRNVNYFKKSLRLFITTLNYFKKSLRFILS